MTIGVDHRKGPMNVQFEWHTEEGEHRLLVQPMRSARLRLGWPVLVVLAVLAFALGVGAGFGWRYWQAQQAMRTDIEAVLAQMRTHLAAGDRAAFLALVDPEDLEWRAEQARWFTQEWRRGIRPQAPLKVVQVMFDGARAAVIVETDEGRSCLHFVLRHGQWFLARGR